MSSFVRSKVAKIEPCDAVVKEMCKKNESRLNTDILSLRGSLTHFVEVEGEPFKAGWFLVILSNKGLTVEVEKERMVMSTQVRECPCIVLRCKKS